MALEQHNSTDIASPSCAAVPHDAIELHGTPRWNWLDWLALVPWVVALHVGLPYVAGQRLQWDSVTHYRLPYALSEDYWLAQQQIAASHRASIVCLGDSVIWGEYVAPQETLPASLQAEIGSVDFVNGGVNGMHPLALEGLVATQLPDLAGRAVLLHCNLLWLSSPDRDLSRPTEQGFNHATLIPQLYPRIPAYRASLSDRLGIASRRQLPLANWVRHAQLSCFDGQDIPHWTLENPRASWLERLQPLGSTSPPATETRSRHAARDWQSQRIRIQNFPWVSLDESVQWPAFQRLVRNLQSDGARPFIVVGPFNKHLLTADSRQRLEHLESSVAAWCHKQAVPCMVATLLPSEEYGDASHPLAAGYRRWARELAEEPAFQQWLAGP